MELMIVPRSLVPLVESLKRQTKSKDKEEGQIPLYRIESFDSDDQDDEEGT